MSGVDDMVRAAERSLGLTGRPNTITRWYSQRNGPVFATAPWCNQSITYWANASGNAGPVCFGRDYAFTVWHAERFRREGQWHVDIAGIRRGDIVFFDWDETNRIGAIDHIGLVTGVGDGVVYTIEGNTSDACRRRARYASTIVGYGRPEYAGTARSAVAAAVPAHAAARGAATGSDLAPPGLPMLQRGSAGVLVKQLQRCLNKVQASRLQVDGDFGPMTTGAVKTFQKRAGGLVADGEYGPRTAGKLTVARKRVR
ncbi:peptidoglycan-binding protein [Phycicoccus sp. M110.8]|uniref:peptidoglycan-binding protein n=1 Tax=Phycicoccus sp. M110.8 TaxID=3075433 RepID=UPI0028FD24F0|nr:peptidoglycan-binding protein [Phycicoccus sp. M110.8]MDU0315016.1 peptidoglycan-binding protein [Phycicoccus sp. M110.8]